ncbi:MAG: hypothetical protein IT289_03590 [Oligoflexia bacterium]|nr:hypothetical protein [Oligoflexia bacterium]
MKKNLVWLVLAVVALSASACNKKSDDNGNAVPPPGHNPQYPYGQQPYGQYPGSINYSQPDIVNINGQGRIVNKTIKVMQGSVEETTQDTCLLDRNGDIVKKRLKANLVPRLNDFILNFDGAGNLSISIIDLRGETRSQGHVAYTLDDVTQSINIEPFIAQGPISQLYFNREKNRAETILRKTQYDTRRDYGSQRDFYGDSSSSGISFEAGRIPGGGFEASVSVGGGQPGFRNDYNPNQPQPGYGPQYGTQPQPFNGQGLATSNAGVLTRELPYGLKGRIRVIPIRPYQKIDTILVNRVLVTTVGVVDALPQAGITCHETAEAQLRLMLR